MKTMQLVLLAAAAAAAAAVTAGPACRAQINMTMAGGGTGKRELLAGQWMVWGPLRRGGVLTYANVRVTASSGWPTGGGADDAPSFDVLYLDDAQYALYAARQTFNFRREHLTELRVSAVATDGARSVRLDDEAPHYFVIDNRDFSGRSPPAGSTLTIDWDELRYEPPPAAGAAASGVHTMAGASGELVLPWGTFAHLALPAGGRVVSWPRVRLLNASAWPAAATAGGGAPRFDLVLMTDEQYAPYARFGGGGASYQAHGARLGVAAAAFPAADADWPLDGGSAQAPAQHLVVDHRCAIGVCPPIGARIAIAWSELDVVPSSPSTPPQQLPSAAAAPCGTRTVRSWLPHYAVLDAGTLSAGDALWFAYHAQVLRGGDDAAPRVYVLAGSAALAAFRAGGSFAVAAALHDTGARFYVATSNAPHYVVLSAAGSGAAVRYTYRATQATVNDASLCDDAAATPPPPSPSPPSPPGGTPPSPGSVPPPSPSPPSPPPSGTPPSPGGVPPPSPPGSIGNAPSSTDGDSLTPGTAAAITLGLLLLFTCFMIAVYALWRVFYHPHHEAVKAKRSGSVSGDGSGTASAPASLQASQQRSLSRSGGASSSRRGASASGRGARRGSAMAVLATSTLALALALAVGVAAASTPTATPAGQTVDNRCYIFGDPRVCAMQSGCSWCRPSVGDNNNVKVNFCVMTERIADWCPPPWQVGPAPGATTSTTTSTSTTASTSTTTPAPGAPTTTSTTAPSTTATTASSSIDDTDHNRCYIFGDRDVCVTQAGCAWCLPSAAGGGNAADFCVVAAQATSWCPPPWQMATTPSPPGGNGNGNGSGSGSGSGNDNLGGLSAGATFGIAAAAIVGCVLLIIIVIFAVYRSQHHEPDAEQQQQQPQQPPPAMADSRLERVRSASGRGARPLRSSSSRRGRALGSSSRRALSSSASSSRR